MNYRQGSRSTMFMVRNARPWAFVLGVAMGMLASPCVAESIVTGGKTGTYFAIGNNLKDIVDPTLEVKDSKGSWANVEDMSKTKGVSLAIVQSDVYSAFVRLRDTPGVPEATRREYSQLLGNLRVFMPLYQEEIHFLVRKDDPLEYIHQIKGKQIWMDMEKSGTYLTALNIYSKIFGERPNIVEPFINPTAIGEDEGTKRRRSALMALSNPTFYQNYPKIDVIILVGGQPLKLLEKAIPTNLKLLKFDPTQPTTAKVLREYQKAEIRKISYPLLNIPTTAISSLAVDSYMITANFSDPRRNLFVKDFATHFCSSFDALQERGHVKWKALTWQPGSQLPPLAAGWQYSDNVKQALGNCHSTSAKPSKTVACSPQDRSTGLCG